MQQKTILGAIIVIVLIACGFAVWKLQKEPTSPPTDTTSTQTSRATLTQLQTDLQGVTPHFLDANRANRQAYTPEEQKIKDDVIAVLTAGQSDNGDYYSGLWLDAVGKRHILVSQPSAGSSIDEIVDSQTGKVTPISAEAAYYLAPEGRNAALYLGNQAIYIYTLDQGGVALVPGSQLSGNETYHSGTSDFQLEPVQTHTKNSITIPVFDSSQIVQNPDALSQPTAMQTMNKKVRDLTLSF